MPLKFKSHADQMVKCQKRLTKIFNLKDAIVAFLLKKMMKSQKYNNSQ